MAHELLFQDDALQAIFFGNVASVPEPPSRLVNIFVSSTKTDMEHERRQLHEVILPRLQHEWSALGVDVQLLDIQTGNEDDAIPSPGIIAQQIKDLDNCYRTSLGCFFLCLVGNKYRPYPLPSSIAASEFVHIQNAANEAGLDVALLDNRYALDTNLIPPRYVLESCANEDAYTRKTDDVTKTRKASLENGTEDDKKLIRVIQYGARIAIQEGLIKQEENSYLLSDVHTHLKHALKLCNGNTERILCIVRQFEGINLMDPAATSYTDSSSSTDCPSVEEDCSSGMQAMLEDVILNINKNNLAFFSIPWKCTGIDTDVAEHKDYLKSFNEIIFEKLNSFVSMVTSTWNARWEHFSTVYRKSVQEVMRESQSQLLNSRRYLRELGVSTSLRSDCGSLLQIQQLMIGEDERMRHTPVIVCGAAGSGKSTLLSQVIMYCPEWLGGDVIRIVRHVGQSPCSTYTSELLRNLCLHISLVFDFEVSPKQQSYELGKLSIWFQDLLKLVESTSTDLVIVLDDLHELRSPPSNQSAILGWLPWNLPTNVHIVCSISEESDTVLKLLRSRMPSGDNFVQIPTLSPTAAISMLLSNLKDRQHTLTTEQTESIRCRLGDKSLSPLYIKLLSRVAERWPSWKETSELLVPSTLEEVVDFILSNLHWSHKSVSDYIKKRYLRSSRDLQACFAELASAFHLGFLMENEKEESALKCNRRQNDWCDILREIDELWFHLLQSGDREKLKQDSICNFDFLQSAINGASISYIRSILELVKCQVLDWEVELLSAVSKQAVDILSQDPSQLATELLNWLKPYSDNTSSPALNGLVTNALKHCNKCSQPLLVPTNSWLTLNLPPQVTQMTCPRPINFMVACPDNQHVLCALDKDIAMYHLATKNLVRTLKGHNDNVTCLHVTSSGQLLVSGSQDTDVIVWQMYTGQIKHRMSSHITGVLCITTTHSESLVLSGSEFGVVIVTNLTTGEIIQKLDTHRGVINCVSVNSGDDIFATGSSDKTVCVWSVEDFALLNTITLSAGICQMDISKDSTFLVLACEDKSLHVRSLTTGSEVHCLQGVAAEVTSVLFAHDHCRCAVGCKDGKCYIFDVHSASLINTLSGHSDPITSVQIQPKDTFLVTAGGNKIVVWNFSTPKKETKVPSKPKVKRVDSHREPICCVAVSKDGTYAVTGSKDNHLKVWNLTTGLVCETLEGHRDPVTCVTFSPNGLFVVSGSEDTTLKVWGLALKQVEATFKEHQVKVIDVSVASDSRRVLSVDMEGHHRLWAADTGTQIYVCSKPTLRTSLYGNTVFAVSGKNQNSLKFWSLMDVEHEKCVSHSDAILCYTVSYDCQTLVTGSQDMSLKVWEVPTGKLTQVLAGHEGFVTCVAVAPLNPSLVVSGSSDYTLILWDLLTGSDTFTLKGHTDIIKCVNVTPDGVNVLSGSADYTIQIWNTQNGERVGMLDLHAPLLTLSCSLNLSQIAVQLMNSSFLPILRLHNNPAKGITVDMLPGFGIQDDTMGPAGRSGMLPKRTLLRGNLKREQSFDSLYWELRSASPKHDFMSTLDELKRSAPFPFTPSIGNATIGSGVWDGTKGGRQSIRASDTMQPKPKLAKHKLLKKQQSMFAFFPDHNQQPSNPNPRDLEAKKADFLLRLQSANKQLDNTEKNSGGCKQNKDAEVTVSSICAIT